MLPIVVAMAAMAETAFAVPVCIASICARICCVARPVCDAQVLHLTGYDGETLPGIARARGLDRRIQRQQIRLARDFVDQVNHITDAGSVSRRR
jgi:hypothetical protein